MLNPGEPPRGYKALELCGAAPQHKHAGSFGGLKVRKFDKAAYRLVILKT